MQPAPHDTESFGLHDLPSGIFTASFSLSRRYIEAQHQPESQLFLTPAYYLRQQSSGRDAPDTISDFSITELPLPAMLARLRHSHCLRELLPSAL
jgi:hypothetical protein